MRSWGKSRSSEWEVISKSEIQKAQPGSAAGCCRQVCVGWGHLLASALCTAWRRGQGRAGAHAERCRLSCVWLSNEHPSASVAFSESTEKKLASCSYFFLCTALGGDAGVDSVLAAKIILCLKFGNCLNTYTLYLWKRHHYWSFYKVILAYFICIEECYFSSCKAKVNVCRTELKVN